MQIIDCSRLSIPLFDIGFCICSEDFWYRQAVSVVYYSFQSRNGIHVFASLTVVPSLIFPFVDIAAMARRAYLNRPGVSG